MPCEPTNTMTAEQTAARALEIAKATAELELGLRQKKIQAVRDARGNVTFTGWSQESRRGCCDACTFRRLTLARSPALAAALAAQPQRQTARR